MIPFGPSAYTLRASLRDVEPEVWRRIVLKSETKLPAPARVLETAVGWGGYHMHIFDVAGILFGEPDDDADDLIDERKVTVKQVLPDTDSALRWDYDLGDGWEHDVLVEAIEEPSPEGRYPTCVAGERACPPRAAAVSRAWGGFSNRWPTRATPNGLLCRLD